MRFDEVYHITPRPGAYRGFYGLLNDVKRGRNKPKRAKVREWLRSQPEYTVFKRT